MMAEACYDPQAAVALWARMEQEEGKRGGAPPQFLSTHPSSHNRMEKIRSWLPDAEMKREQGGCGFTGGQGEFNSSYTNEISWLIQDTLVSQFRDSFAQMGSRWR